MMGPGKCLNTEWLVLLEGNPELREHVTFTMEGKPACLPFAPEGDIMFVFQSYSLYKYPGKESGTKEYFCFHDIKTCERCVENFLPIITLIYLVPTKFWWYTESSEILLLSRFFFVLFFLLSHGYKAMILQDSLKKAILKKAPMDDKSPFPL